MSNHNDATTNSIEAGEPVHGQTPVKRQGIGRKRDEVRGEPGLENSLWTKIAIPLLIGIVAAGAGFFGARSGANATLEAQRLQLISQHNDIVRTKREAVYQQYLKAADTYDVASSNRYSECIGKKTCSANVAGWQNARYNYQGALNAVYTYGSNKAWQQTHEISAALPPSLASGDTPPGRVNDDLFRSGYTKFLTIMCREVNPDPQH